MPNYSRKHSSTRKGRLVEELAAHLMRTRFASAETRVFLPTLKGRTREIDILVTVNLPSGQKLRYAVECKNETAPIEAEYIDAFLGKLLHVGIPVGQGIFVSRSSFRQGALDRAEEAGIRTLRINGLKDDGLTHLIYEAIQSVIWLLADVTELTIASHAVDSNILFVDEEGNYMGLAPDLIHRAWIEGQIPYSIGGHEIELTIPPHWLSSSSTGPVEAISARARVQVSGIAYTVYGQTTLNTLTHSPSGQFESGAMNARWDINRDRIQISHLRTQAEVEEHIEKLPGVLKVIRENLPLPRLNIRGEYGRMYWPPSEDVAKILFDRFQNGQSLGSPDDDFEGTEFSRLFDEPYPGYAPKWQP